ncbi:MAG: hypothetical protein ACOY0T_20645 [Myxococcota bacterium]
MKRWRRWVLLAGVVWGCFLACSPAEPDGANYSPARLLDRICADGGCIFEGSARQIRGITPDSLGVEIGRAPGKFSFSVEEYVQASADHVEVAILMRGEGVTSTGKPLSPEYSWQSTGLDANPGLVSIEVGEGSHAVIADVRVINEYYTPGCE